MTSEIIKKQSESFKANLFRGIEAVGGILILSDKGIRFEPHSLNIQKSILDLDYSNIKRAKKRNTLGFIPNGFSIVTLNGEEYKFVVWQRSIILELIRLQLKILNA